MFKKLIYFVVCLLPYVFIAQNYSAQWKGHFSYNNINSVSQGKSKIYAAAENAIFSLDTESNNLEEINTVNGLSGETISTIYYSEEYELLVIGYENGLIEIAFDNSDDVLAVVDIIEKPTIPDVDKRINHFYAYENVLYVSTNYGISVFSLERLEFGDTYFIGDGGSQIQVNQTIVFEGNIYAACSDNSGIRMASIANPNLIDFKNWTTIAGGDFVKVSFSYSNLYSVRTDRRLYQIVNNNLIELIQYQDLPLDIRYINETLIVTTKNNVYIYDEGFNLISQVGVPQEFITQFTSATRDLENIYVGTVDFGLLKTDLLNPMTFEEIHPDGPLLNKPFSIQAEADGVWVTFGEYDLYYNPYPLNSRGFSHLKSDLWINTPYEDVFEAKCLNKIAVNPNVNDEIYISSFFSGILQVKDEIPVYLYDEANSGLESIQLPNNPNYVDIRMGSTVFDNNGLLWSVTSRVKRPLKSFNVITGQWKSYDFSSIITDALNDNLGFTDVTIDFSNSTKFIASYSKGLIGFKENNGGQSLKALNGEENNLPSNLVSALALDKRNQLWIGTYSGLRVLYNPSNFFQENDIRVDEIIIEEDGVAKELLFQQFITDIKVDGSNNKWIGTNDSGLFYFSPDGQQTIFHFTKENSPLPSNSIRDVSIDDTNGIVYIATSKGLVSFKSGGSSPIENLESAFVYPNPVRPNFNMVDKKVKIKDISENVNIKITDIEGNLVAEAQSRTNQRYNGYNLEIDGGTAYWNGKNLANNDVASGVYLVMLSDLDTYETKVLKIMVVR
ncbi:type IX secretion system anionic LPS delivery protein PorZ [Gaetbulibacter saemankumensis]|uniref:type IX secretion system anionic LPS delivery protein PorZ n=1 Tax=Gaetbulibacter saemankumensis TaxID=311208 RepID=UPI00041D7279|nr:two-component regulator propeller domain-containing protein [Gaetbulibacter saemankumensis]